MIVTTIKFVGLIVTTMLANPPGGVKLVMGDFAPIVPPHNRVIAWPKGTRVPLSPSEEWPKNGEFTTPAGAVYEYANVTNQLVTISGPTEQFGLAMDKIPHLTCCCAPFKNGFNPSYGDPGGLSAFFTLTHGTYTTFPESSGAVSTALGLTENVDIVFEGTTGGSTKKIKLHPPQPPTGTYVVIVANTPLAVLEGKPVHGPADFKNYYRMGKGTESCTALPGDPPPNACAPRTTSCDNVPATLNSVKARKIAEQIRNVLNKTRLMVDVNCSSSQWP